LLNKVISNYQAAKEYELMKFKLGGNAAGIAMWDMDIVNGDPVNPDNKIIWSQEFRQMLGFSNKNDFPDKLHSWSDRLHPEDKERTLKAFEMHMKDHTGKITYDVKYRLVMKNGQYRDFHALGATLRNDAGVPIRVAGTLQDITEKKQMEEALKRRERMMNTLNETAIMLLESDYEKFDDVMSNSMKPVAAVAGIDRVAVYQLLDGKAWLGQKYLWYGKTVPLDDKLVKLPEIPPIKRWMEKLSKGECINNNLKNMEYDEVVFLSYFGVKSIYMVSIFVRGEFWGVITLEDHTNYRFFEEEILDLLRSAAHLYASAIVRAEMEREIIATKDFNTTILDAAPIGYAIIDTNMSVVDSNDTIINAIGTTKQNFSDNFFRFSPEIQADGSKSSESAIKYMKKALNGEKQVFEWEHRSVTGELIPSEITLIRTTYKGKNMLQAYQYDLRNIKEMKEHIRKQEELLKTQHEQRELISDISKCFTSSGNPQTFVNEAITKFGKNYKVSMVYIFGIDYENNKTYPAYHWSSSGEPSRLREFNLYGFIKEKFPERLHGTNTMLLISEDDIAASTDATLRSLLSIHIHAFICAPLYVEDRLWGVLTVEQYFVPRQWKKAEKDFILIVVDAIAGVIMRDFYNKELNKALHYAEVASKAKGDFLSNMSHEMRTPLNAITGMTLIGKNTDDLERKNYALNKIENASTHLLGVINDVLDMSKIEANKFELSPDEFSFEKMLQQVENVINFRIDEKKQTLTINIDDAIPEYLIGDDQRLAQVITNLLSNAVKFTPEGGAVYLNTRFLGEKNDLCTLQISITDTGIGISPQQQSRLFKSFHQAESSTVRKYGGTGLGLAISKSIVELMGGKIWIESEIGKGSTFAFTIQVKQSEKNMQQSVTAQTISEPLDEKKELDGSFAGRHILLVEDVEINREIVMTILEPIQLEIECAENGLQAVDKFCNDPEKYDLIFMDVQMPEMDGYDATRHIRTFEAEYETKASKPYKRVPIIAMTANVFKEDIDKCLDAGMNDHIGKPLDFKLVMEKLQTYLK
jgi:PAS domain S-box-containing protein